MKKFKSGKIYCPINRKLLPLKIMHDITIIYLTPASGQYKYKYFISKDLSFFRRHQCPQFHLKNGDLQIFCSHHCPRFSFQLFSSESILSPPLNFRIYIYILFLFLPRKETSSFVSFSFSESPLDPSAPQRGRKKLVSIQRQLPSSVTPCQP